MIAAIPAEDRPTVIEKSVPPSKTISEFIYELERDRDGEGLLKLASIRVRADLYNDGKPLTCLSCGAKTNTAGELPCGH